MTSLNYYYWASIVMIVLLAIVNVYSLPITSDEQITVEQYRDECNVSKQLLKIGKDKFSENEQMQHYIEMLESGINELMEKTENIIEHETDDNKKRSAIQYGYDSCNRLMAFISDIYEKIKPKKMEQF